MKNPKWLLCSLVLLLAACDLTNDAKPQKSETISYQITTVYENSDYQEIYPIAFSPSGDRILMTVTDSEGSNRPAIVNLDGSGFHVLTTKPGTRRVFGFSPDGTKILYTYGKAIFVAGTDNSTPVQLVAGGGGNDPVKGDNNPVAFSPDGQFLLYNTFYGYEKGWRINIVNADGSNFHQLIDFSATAVGFSPDGSKILYGRNIKGDADVWTMDSDGQNKINLTKTENPEGPRFGQGPVSFTANGNRILYTNHDSGNGIMLMDPDGSNKTMVSNNFKDVPTVATADGQIIAFYQAALTGICPYCSADGIGLIQNDGSKRTIFENEEGIYTRIVDFSPDGRKALLGSTDGNGGEWKILVAAIEK